MIINEKNDIFFYYKAMAGLLVLFIGLGLCRFAYTPLIPSLILGGWLTKTTAGLVGTSNYLGYLFGVLFVRQLSYFFKMPILINFILLIAVLSLALCSINLGFFWFATWRFLAGIVGAFFMIFTPSLVLQDVPLPLRGRISGIVFSGIGLGIIVAGFFPLVAKINLNLAWLSIAFLGAIFAFCSYFIFNNVTSLNKINNSAVNSKLPLHHRKCKLYFIFVSYFLFSIGGVAHMLFLIDYVHIELNLSPSASGIFWTIFGIGSLLGPVFSGILVDKIGINKTLVSTYFLSCLGISIILFNHYIVLYVFSSFGMGLLLFSMLTLFSLKILELVGIDYHAIFWNKMTLIYSIGQAVSAYSMSIMISYGMSYSYCFLISDLAIFLGGVSFILSFFDKAHVRNNPYNFNKVIISQKH